MQQSDALILTDKSQTHFLLQHHSPCAELSDVIERYWSASWSLEHDQVYQQKTVPPPCFNFSFSAERAVIAGIFPRRFELTIQGRGVMFGAKLKPGALHVFCDHVVASDYFDRVEPLSQCFGAAFDDLHQLVLSGADPRACVDACDALLGQMARAPDREYETIQHAIGAIIDADVMTVQQLCDQLDLKTRTLQRLFKKYVGVSPKWVICRYRIQRAIDLLSHQADMDCAMLAVQLGYYDQSHFINDFKMFVGVPPQQYITTLT